MRKQWRDALHASRIKKGECSSWGRLYSWEYLYLSLLGKVLSFHDRHLTSQTFLSNTLISSLSISITFPLQPKSGDFPWALHTSAGAVPPAWELLYRDQTKPCSCLQLEDLQSVSQFLSVQSAVIVPKHLWLFKMWSRFFHCPSCSQGKGTSAQISPAWLNFSQEYSEKSNHLSFVLLVTTSLWHSS